MKIYVLTASVLLSAVGCSAPVVVQKNRAALQQNDGRMAFLAGKGIGDAIDKGLFTDDNGYPSAFMRLRVPVEFVDQAVASKQQIKTVSFEVPGPAIEATVHYRSKDGSFKTLYFHPGDPFVSGYAQVGVTSDKFTMGLFEIIKWNRDPTQSMPNVLAQEIHSTGLLPDDNMPTLLFAEDPTKMPDTWQ